MSGKSAEEYELYNSYLDRSSSTVSTPETAEPISAENRTDELSRKILEKQNELLKTFPNLSLISNTLEDTIIVVDDNGEETPESEDRRRNVLAQLEAALKSDKSLLERTRAVYPEFCRKMEDTLGSKYYSIYAKAVTNLRMLCGSISATPVFDDSEFDYDDLTESDLDEGVYIEPVEDEEEMSEISSYSKMLIKISKKLDTNDFQRACIIAKTYLKDQLNRYSRAVIPGRVEADIQRFAKENNDSLDIINRYTAYLNMPKTFDRTEEEQTESREDITI